MLLSITHPFIRLTAAAPVQKRRQNIFVTKEECSDNLNICIQTDSAWGIKPNLTNKTNEKLKEAVHGIPSKEKITIYTVQICSVFSIKIIIIKNKLFFHRVILFINWNTCFMGVRIKKNAIDLEFLIWNRNLLTHSGLDSQHRQIYHSHKHLIHAWTDTDVNIC